jgi:hypothetical protein
MNSLDRLVDIVLLALATGAVVDVWFDGSIFAAWRARAEAWENAFSELLGCRLCLTYQAVAWLTLGLWALPQGVPRWLALGLQTLLVALAAGRLAWLIDRVGRGPEAGAPAILPAGPGSPAHEEDPG